MIKKSYTYRYGVIQRVARGKATVELKKMMKKSACKGCTLCATDIPTITFTVAVTTDQFKVGDQVAVGTQEMNEAEAALIAFGLPVFGALTTFFLLTGLFHWEGESLPTVATTLVVGALSFFGVAFVDKILRIISPVQIIPVDELMGTSIEEMPTCNV